MWSNNKNKGYYFWREATVVFFSVVKILFLFASLDKNVLCISNTNTYTNSEDYVWIRRTPPVTRKKFHLPHRASRGKRGTKGERVHQPRLAVEGGYFQHLLRYAVSHIIYNI